MMMLTWIFSVMPFFLGATIAQPTRPSECMNGGEFKTTDNGENYCDCTNAFGEAHNAPHRGHLCEHVATEYCEYGVTMSNLSFCANGGTCKAKVYGGQSEAKHMGCNCDEDYEGPHCEYFLGTGPRIDSQSKQSARFRSSKKIDPSSDIDSGAPAGLVVIIVGCALVVVFGVALFIQYKRSDIDHTGEFATSVGDLDPDGSSLMEMKMMEMRKLERRMINSKRAEETVEFTRQPTDTAFDPDKPISSVSVQKFGAGGSVLRRAISTPLPDDDDDFENVPAADTTRSPLAAPPADIEDDERFGIC